MDAPQSLCPGYQQVESFGQDDIYEDEEVFYVTLDMGNVEPTLVPSSTSYRLIGLDTPTPYIQLQGTILKGRHDLLLGTEMIFTDDKESHDWNTRSVVHVGNTEQRVAFQEVTLIPKIPATANEVANINMEPSTEERTAQIDRMTGLSGPPPRASRSRKSTASGKARSKGKEKAKETATSSSYATRSSKGKEKEVAPPLDDMLTMDATHDDDEDTDDMYVDE
ncbi:hypothetical protein JR316_0012617 [Psilocybe cubensis]|uniref:Transcription factor TFIIIC triple barrel domain-containing protein n=2 Tax=Psilocybe cubensis TaxID=181762 RepID=A0A8H7XQE2_PSICU|nr:hypothetical protein JR316_0012617 [Psilocybe cubensis]KAH9475502.1 hypothetical protein JR316_0012617 [Psilocybe cubensis]